VLVFWLCVPTPHVHTHGSQCARAHIYTKTHARARTQVPALNIFETSYRRGKFDESRMLSNGQLMEFKHILPMDAVFDTQEDVPEEVGCMRWGAAGARARPCPGLGLGCEFAAHKPPPAPPPYSPQPSRTLQGRGPPSPLPPPPHPWLLVWPPQIATNKRYAGATGWTVSECAAKVAKEVGNIDILVSAGRRVLWAGLLGSPWLAAGWMSAMHGCSCGRCCGLDWRERGGASPAQPAEGHSSRAWAFAVVGELTSPLHFISSMHAPASPSWLHTGALTSQRPRGAEAPDGDFTQGGPPHLLAAAPELVTTPPALLALGPALREVQGELAVPTVVSTHPF